MSDLIVKVVKIKEVLKHPNADRLDLVSIDGWQCVGQRDFYKVGDLVVYIPIDSILSVETEAKLFGPDSKIKLHKSRVKTIKIRGAISQGMLADLPGLGLPALAEGTDVTKKLGITKYEPPAASTPGIMNVGKVRKKKVNNPNFKEYGGLDNFKNYNKLFEPGELVVITEKIHGTNFRCGLVKNDANTLWRKFLKFIGRLPEHEFVFGSNKVQLQRQPRKKTYYDENVYAKTALPLAKLFKPGEVLYGEIYGSGIQKDYAYGCAEGEQRLAVFDLVIDGVYQDHDTVASWCRDKGLLMVPELYRGVWDEAVARSLTKGPSVLAPSQKVREGNVIRTLTEQKCFLGRKMLKLVSDEYLLGDQTDHH